jgi:hypothetical protein
MGGLVMVEGPKKALHSAVQSLTAHQLDVCPTKKGYLISDGCVAIEATIDSDDNSVVFLCFSSWNPFHWHRAGRLVNRVEGLLKDYLRHAASGTR